jgi:hypothetical protein
MNVYLTSDIHTYTDIHRYIHSYDFQLFVASSQIRLREPFKKSWQSRCKKIIISKLLLFVKNISLFLCGEPTQNTMYIRCISVYVCISRCIFVYVCISDVRYTFMHIPMYICVCMYIWRQIYILKLSLFESKIVSITIDQVDFSLPLWIIFFLFLFFESKCGPISCILGRCPMYCLVVSFDCWVRTFFGNILSKGQLRGSFSVSCRWVLFLFVISTLSCLSEHWFLLILDMKEWIPIACNI